MGLPIAMVRARRAHDRVVVNAIRSPGNQLDGNPCQPFSDDSAVCIPNGNTRRPDVGVDCGQFDPDALAVGSPRLVLEVLSPTTRAEMEPLWNVSALHVTQDYGMGSAVPSSRRALGALGGNELCSMRLMPSSSRVTRVTASEMTAPAIIVAAAAAALLASLTT
jgi:hypothetical protein